MTLGPQLTDISASLWGWIIKCWHAWLGKVPTHEAAEYQVQCWEQEESHMGSYLTAMQQKHGLPRTSGCTVILPWFFLSLFWHCNSSWPFPNPSSSLAFQGWATDMFFGLSSVGITQILYRGSYAKILSYGRIFSATFILFDTAVVDSSQASHLCHNYVKTHHAIHVHLGKLIMKRIKTVTMGLILCAKHSYHSQGCWGVYTPWTWH